MTTFEKVLQFILKEEGGFVDDPDDPGGRTNYGITQKTYTDWLKKYDRPDRDVKHIDLGDVGLIYKELYWLAGRCDQLPWPISLIHMDGCVNVGPTRAALLLQKAAGVKEDGHIGPQTLGAASRMNPYALIRLRLRYYRKLTRLRKFLPQWVARIEHLMKELEATP